MGADNYAAHIREKDGTIQSIKDHCDHVASLARKFGKSFNFDTSDMLTIIGELHDVGKYSVLWQKYIRQEVSGRKIDHSSAGVQEIEKIYSDASPALRIPMESCVAGHHAGLLNVGVRGDQSELGASLFGRLSNHIEDCSCYKNYVTIPEEVHPPKGFAVVADNKSEIGNFSLAFMTRMLFSCLVDADFLDTESFMNGGRNREKPVPLKALAGIFREYIAEHHYLEGESGINAIRSGILRDCIRTGSQEEGELYTLTVPTGGGKTVSSMAFALEKALKSGRERIIYVIPYCSIIDQTAEVFGNIFGGENILAAFGNADYEGKDHLRLAPDNWDAPIIITTAVQFFESLYGNRTSRVRKLHNIANSVVVFDEAQTIPIPRLLPCIRAIKELIVNYRVTCVMCTATQPSFQKFFVHTYVNRQESPISANEICGHLNETRERLKRVTYRQRGYISDEDLAAELSGCSEALCIVSTKSQAASLFEIVRSHNKFHLSTNMTPVHRRNVLQEVRERLQNEESCILISTSLIEAGVDVDFPVVYRANAGLDSEIQAAGRCNREGKRSAEDSIVNLFDADSKYRIPASLEAPYETTRMVVRNVKDIADYRVVNRYYQTLYNSIGEGLDVHHTVDAFEKAVKLNYPFAYVGEEFHLIDQDTYSILIPDDSNESEEICYKLRNDFMLSRAETRFINLHSVSVYPYLKDKLQNMLEPIDERHFILTDSSAYDDGIGLVAGKAVSGMAFFV